MVRRGATDPLGITATSATLPSRRDEETSAIRVNGNLFTDNIRYDLAHRAAGRDEVKLHDALRYIHRYVRRFAGAEASWYMKPNSKKL